MAKKILLNYNFDPEDLGASYEDLYNFKRRDSCFVFVYEEKDCIFAFRDHFGQIPLYYRIFPSGEISFSISQTSLLDSQCQLDLEGLKYYLSFSTTRVKPLFKEIRIVPPGSVIKINKNKKEINLLYQYFPRKKSYKLKSFKDYVQKFEELLLNALKRTLKESLVGLLLSGGIDSGLTGYYLKKLGVKLNAYTCAPWGRRSSEIKYSKMNAETIGVENHFLSYLEEDDYLGAFKSIFSLYENIIGTTTILGVSKLYKDSPIMNEKQVYYAQNCDTATCSVSAQNVAFFSIFIPYSLRKFLHKHLSEKNILGNYLNFFSKGLITENKEFEEKFSNKKLSEIEKISLAGIFIVHSQSDSEVITDPLIQRNILVSNPFFDVDLVEFFLGIPFRYRLAFLKNAPTKISLDKLVVRKLASEFLPRELCKRKKGFTVPFEKLPQDFFDGLPEIIGDLAIRNLDIEQKFNLKIFLEWCKYLKIKV